MRQNAPNWLRVCLHLCGGDVAETTPPKRGPTAAPDHRRNTAVTGKPVRTPAPAWGAWPRPHLYPVAATQVYTHPKSCVPFKKFGCSLYHLFIYFKTGVKKTPVLINRSYSVPTGSSPACCESFVPTVFTFYTGLYIVSMTHTFPRQPLFVRLRPLYFPFHIQVSVCR